MAGYPVALSLTGVSLGFAAIGTMSNVFDTAYISLIPNRIYGLLLIQLIIGGVSLCIAGIIFFLFIKMATGVR